MNPLRKWSSKVSRVLTRPHKKKVATLPGRQRAPRSLWRSLSGLTLIELLIVLAVLALLIAIGIPFYNGMIARAQETAALAHITQWPTAQALFYTDNRRFATSLDDLYNGGYLIPANSAKIGYTFEISDLIAQAPSQDQPMLASTSYRPDDPWWQWLGLVKLAWADDKDKGQGKAKGKNKNKDEADNEDQGGSSSGTTFSVGGLGWEGYADPVGARPRHFYIDQTKTIRYAIGRRANRYDPPVDDTIHTGGDSNSGSKDSGPGSVNSGSGKPGRAHDLPPTGQGRNPYD